MPSEKSTVITNKLCVAIYYYCVLHAIMYSDIYVMYSFSLLKKHLVRGGGVFYDVYIMTCYFSLTVHRAVLKITILSE